jgi:glycosyltransferase involved in cell wall biosynthesis
LRVLTITNMYPDGKRSFFGSFVRDRVEALRRLGVEMDVWISDAALDGKSAYIRHLPSLWRLLRREPFDVLHCEHTWSMLQLAAVRPRKAPPSVFTIHEAEALHEGGSQEAEGLLRRLVYRKGLKLRALRAADRVVCVNPELPPAVGFHGRFDVIRPGVDLDRFRPIDRVEARSRLNLAQDVPIAFFPANPSRRLQKGTPLYEEARELLGPGVHWLVGGEIPFDDMPLYINAADVIVQTSRFEASPMVAKEALACNRPLVSTDVGDVRELFGQTPGVFLTTQEARDVAAKIELALAAGLDGLNGRARVIELGLGLDDVARRYLELYEELIRERRAA